MIKAQKLVMRFPMMPIGFVTCLISKTSGFNIAFT
jgi:hypothetical protein